MKVCVFSKIGKKKNNSIILDKSIFEIEINDYLLKRSYDAYLARLRVSKAKTKTRGEVRGGGKKPWRQKGTGRARVGSIRVPNWKGGGVIFGPTGRENYNIKISKYSKNQAIKCALSSKAKEGNIIILDEINNKNIKTKLIIELINKIGAKGNILLIVDKKTPQLELSIRNIANIELITAKYISVYNVINADTIILTIPALNMINEWLGVKK